MEIVILTVLVINRYIVLCAATTSLEYKPLRPSYAGATGGNWGSYVGQIIPPGKPWPSKAEDYEGFSATSTKSSLENRFGANSTAATTPKIVPTDLGTISETEGDLSLNNTHVSLDGVIKDTTTTHSSPGLGSFRPEDEIIIVPQLPVPNRPPFMGATGGNFIPQSIQPGKPWPARPEDYENFNTTSQKPNVEQTIKETTTNSALGLGSLKPGDEILTVPQLPVPNRPPFMGAIGGNFIPQIIQPGKPWPAKPEDYEAANTTSQKPNVEQTINETTTYSTLGLGSFRPEDEIVIVPQLPIPNRPPFMGATGGNFTPQSVQPGEPWPARPEDYENFNSTSQKPNIEQTIKETTTNSALGLGTFKPEDEILTVPQLPVPNRPPFMGATGGNFIPQSVQPGRPWPARPEDYENFNTTSQKPNVEQTIKETTTNSAFGLGSFKPEDEILTVPQLPIPNRPPLMGATGGNFIPQSVQPGEPWPARPEDYDGFNKTSQKPNVEDSVKETTTLPFILSLSTLRSENEAVTTTQLPVLNGSVLTLNNDHSHRTDYHENINATSQKTSLEETVEGTTIGATQNLGKNDLNTFAKVPIPNLLNSIEDTGENVIPLTAPLANSPSGIKDNESGIFTLAERVKEVNVTSLMIDEISTETEDKSELSNQTHFETKMPLISIYLNLEDIKHAIESSNKNTDGSSNTNKDAAAHEFIFTGTREPTHDTDDIIPKPSLAISLDLNALKRTVESSLNESQKEGPIKKQEQFLSAEKVGNDGIQNNLGFAAINLGDFGTTNSTSVRLNFSNGVSSKPNEDSPFLSIFLNIEDFENAVTDFSSDNKAEGSSKYFHVAPSKTTNDSTTLHPSFPHLGHSDATVRRNASTLITPEAEIVLA